MDMSDYAADVAVSGAAYVAHGVAGFMLPQLIYKQLGPKAAAAAEEHIPGMQSLGLVVSLHLCMAVQHPELFKLTVNPWDMELWQLAGLSCLFMTLKRVFNWMMQQTLKVLSRGPLEFREKHPEVKNEPLVWADYVHVAFRELWELLANTALIGWVSSQEGYIAKELDEMTFANTVLALWVGLVVNDIAFAATHYALHHRVIYPYVHKHHHRILVPSTLVEDALNYHAIETPIGYVLLLSSIGLGGWVCGGLHALALPMYLAVYLFFQCMNHSDQDVQLTIPFLSFASGAHEMHHRVPTCNFANYAKWIDQVAGTYKEYRNDIYEAYKQQ